MIKFLHVSCAKEVSTPFVKLVGNKETYYSFLSSSLGMSKNMFIFHQYQEQLLNGGSACLKTLHQWMTQNLTGA
jgi:hypothetical protein